MKKNEEIKKKEEKKRRKKKKMRERAGLAVWVARLGMKRG